MRILVFLTIIFLVSLPVLTSANEGIILFHSLEEDGSWIYSIDTDGTGLKKLIKNGLSPVLSPDKKMFAYMTSADKVNDPRNNKIIISISDLTGKVLFTVDPIKTKIVGIEKYDLPGYYVWSPDGNKLSILSLVRERFIHVRIYDINTQKVQDIFNAKVEDFDSAYSSSYVEWLDNKRLLFNGSLKKAEIAIKIVNLESNKIEEFQQNKIFLVGYFEKSFLGVLPSEKVIDFILFDEKGNEKEKILHLDKAYILGSRVVNNKILLYIMGKLPFYRNVNILNLNNKQIEKIEIPRDYSLFSPEFSPDGNKFICVIVNEKEDKGGYYIYNINSKKLVLLYAFKKIDRDYLKALYCGIKRKDYSWK